MATESLILHADYNGTDKGSSSAYRQLILDFLDGEHTAFLRFDEVEAAWQILEPVLRAWKRGGPDLYPAGSDGPACQEHVLEKGHSWRNLEYEPIREHA
jgi:glucose-6-phosphate 1-dehydrogenase